VAWQDIARQIAPTLAAGLLGPLGGVVAKVAADALFPGDPQAKEKATPERIIQRIAKMTSPEEVARLKQAELDVQKFEADTRIRLAEIEQHGIEGARVMRVAALASGNKTADTLSFIVMASFLLVAAFVLLGCYMAITGRLPVTEENRSVWIGVSGLVGAIVGYFSANAQQVVGFYFGSSAGSAAKTDQLAEATANAFAATANAPRAAAPDQPTPPSARAQGQVGQATISATGRAAEELAERDAVGPNGEEPLVTERTRIRSMTPRPLPTSIGSAAGSTAVNPELANRRWAACVAHVLKHEGGFSEHHADPGGATKRGITRATLQAWRGEEVSVDDVQNLSEQEAREIYRANYWNGVRCDELPPGVDLMVFDACVMSGPKQAAKFLQRAAGMPEEAVDGVVGSRTLGAVQRHAPADLVEAIARQRDAFFDLIVQRKPQLQAFTNGWKSRLRDTRAIANRMARDVAT
jgi:lysozyme family protein